MGDTASSAEIVRVVVGSRVRGREAIGLAEGAQLLLSAGLLLLLWCERWSTPDVVRSVCALGRLGADELVLTLRGGTSRLLLFEHG